MSKLIKWNCCLLSEPFKRMFNYAKETFRKLSLWDFKRFLINSFRDGRKYFPRTSIKLREITKISIRFWDMKRSRLIELCVRFDDHEFAYQASERQKELGKVFSTTMRSNLSRRVSAVGELSGRSAQAFISFFHWLKAELFSTENPLKSRATTHNTSSENFIPRKLTQEAVIKQRKIEFSEWNPSPRSTMKD